MKDMEFYKEFKLCAQGKENVGYMKWNAKVNSELSKLPDDNLINMQKRFEWRNSKAVNEENGFFTKLFSNLSQYIVLLLTILVSIQALHQQTLLGIQNLKNDEAIDINGFIEVFSSWNISMMEICLGGVLFAAIMVAILYIVDKLFEDRKNNRILYYGEMREVIKIELKERKRKKKQCKGQKDNC